MVEYFACKWDGAFESDGDGEPDGVSGRDLQRSDYDHGQWSDKQSASGAGDTDGESGGGASSDWFESDKYGV